MSALPESKLAREAEMAYQMICMSTDYDCWHETEEDVNVALVMQNMKANAENARRFVAAVLDELSKDEHAELVAGKHLEGMTKGGLSTAKEGVEGRGKETIGKLKWLFPGYFD
jgi:5'-methylthioadenosine phosphorylase